MKRLSKRQFLKGAILVSGTVLATPLLAACQQAAPPAPTAAPPAASQAAPTQAPASKPAPTAAAKAADAATPAPAASAPPKAKEPVTLRFHMRSGGDKSEPAIYVERPKEWEEESGNKVKLEPIVGDYAGKLLALAAGGAIGDLTFTDMMTANHDRYVKGGILEPVDDYLKSRNILKTEWEKPIIDYLTHDGKLYGLPKSGHALDSFVWINLKMFEEAGIKEPPTYGNTFDDLATWANKLSKGPPDRRDVYGYFANTKKINAVTNGVRAWGGDVVDASGTKSLADTQPWMDWAQWNNKLITQDKVNPAADAIPDAGLQSMFGAGKVAMVFKDRSFHRPAKLAVGDKFPFAVIQFPKSKQAIGWGISINTHTGTSASKYKEQTFGLVYALADKRFAYLVAKEQGYLTGRVDNMEAIGDLGKDPFLQLQLKNQQEGAAWWRAKNLRSAEIQTAIDNHMDLLWLGQRQLDSGFMNELKQAVDQILKKPDF